MASRELVEKVIDSLKNARSVYTAEDIAGDIKRNASTVFAVLRRLFEEGIVAVRIGRYTDRYPKYTRFYAHHTKVGLLDNDRGKRINWKNDYIYIKEGKEENFELTRCTQLSRDRLKDAR